MGVEVEVHGLSFTFRRTNAAYTDVFWVPPTGAMKREETMISHQPILVPESFADTAAAQTIPGMVWEGDWGFIVCGDAFGTEYATLQSTQAQVAFVRCTALEVNTAAHEISDSNYWLASRAAIRIFRDAIASFAASRPTPPPNGQNLFGATEPYYAIDDIVRVHNAMIDAHWLAHGWNGGGYPAARDFRLKKSFHLEEFETQGTGRHLGVTGNWKALVAVRRWSNQWSGQTSHFLHCEPQVNYQIDLEYMFEHLEEWLAIWSHMWLHDVIDSTQPTKMTSDPASGQIKSTPLNDIYRTWISVALWRMGKEQADAFVERLLTIAPLGLATLPPRAIVQLKSLVMMMLAIGAISPGVSADGGTSKNAYAQLSKTSLASIVAAIAATPNQLMVLRRLGHDTTYLELGGMSIAAYAHSLISGHRTGLRQNLAPYLPAGGPGRNAVSYASSSGGLNDTMLTSAMSPIAVIRMWKGAFSPAQLTAANKFGYLEAAPFYCYWALAHTSKAAERVAGGRIKILFESRYGTSRFNLGFHPDTREETFYEAYKSIFMLTVPDRTERSAVLDVAKETSSSRSRSKYRDRMDQGQRRGVH